MNNLKEKAIFMVDLLEHLGEMNIYIPDIASEEFGLDIDYSEITEIVECLKNMINNSDEC